MMNKITNKLNLKALLNPQLLFSQTTDTKSTITVMLESLQLFMLKRGFNSQKGWKPLL